MTRQLSRDSEGVSPDSATRGLAYHESLALLGVGDLHPGGRAATEFLLRELDQAAPRRVLEIGAGMGRTTERLLQRGWQVTALEPNPVMRGVLEKRLGIRAVPDVFENFASEEPFDALIAESVFYRFDLDQAFARAHRLLRPGGKLALNDMVWTDRAPPDVAKTVAAQTKSVYGIPGASATALTWENWRQLLRSAGFVEETCQRIGSTPPEPGRRRRLLLNGLRHPIAFGKFLSYRRAMRQPALPADWLESWLSVWRRI